MEKRISFKNQGYSLEGKFTKISQTHAAIITHPHPLYGGDMDNPVVEIVAEAYQDKGWSTLRFNFRGTGNSGGQFDNGIGEQKDVDAAIAFLSLNGFQEFELPGYSFGAWVLAARARKRMDHPHPLRFIAPPVAFMDFNGIYPLEGLKQVVIGTKDEFAPLEQIESLVPQWNPQAEFNVIENADHFYWNQMGELQNVLNDSICKTNE